MPPRGIFDNEIGLIKAMLARGVKNKDTSSSSTY